MASVSGLVAIVSLLAQRDDLGAILYLVAVIVAIMAINYLCLRSCKYIVRAVGPTVLQVVGRIMGVILVSLAVELILMGFTAWGSLPSIRWVRQPPHRHQQPESADFRGLVGPPFLIDLANSTGATSPNRADHSDWNRLFRVLVELHAVIVLKGAVLRADSCGTIGPPASRFPLEGPRERRMPSLSWLIHRRCRDPRDSRLSRVWLAAVVLAVLSPAVRSSLPRLQPRPR